MKKHPEINYGGASLHDQRAPDVTGLGGSLWRVQLVEPSIVGLWLVHAPEAHPMWEYYAVSLFHLREIEGYSPPEKDSPEMEYQITVMALDPREKLPSLSYLELEDYPQQAIHALHPTEFQAQFKPVGGDHIAYEIGDELCQLVVQNNLLPDSDYRVQWSMHLANKVVTVMDANSNRGVQ